jgi:valyl-tRNA synthetase
VGYFLEPRARNCYDRGTMNTPVQKKSGYQPQEWEDNLYQRWQESDFFNPDTCLAKGIAQADKEPFSMVLPPPNATGTLHTGSACMLAIEDTFTRVSRMQGRPTLWLPGTDHAAIATQSKVERLLWEQEQKTRYDIGREALLQRIGEFVTENQGTMRNQMRKMGSSLDWSREAFTLDVSRNQAVNKAFKQMYDDGIIYRGDRIVNWDPKGQTTISDDEIVYKEETTKLYYFQYGPFVISTARPETKFGDKYVVMHPDDTRYAKYQHGQQLDLEWINGSITATIIKDEAIDMEFGTGVMTITPWHSGIDFDIAERHNLDKEQIIDLNGDLLPIAGEFSGMSIRDAREKIVEKLKKKGLLVKVEENYVHQVATAERTGEVIEPQIMRQWFVGVEREFLRDGKTTTLKKLMQEAIVSRGGDITILPARFEKIYFHWIDNLRDWCISRQIWYGHRIPVYYKGGEMMCSEKAPPEDGWEQDPDTLDTWFSSALWTFSTLGWGYDDALWEAQKKYHPTTLLETGYDILPFWVSRMILMSTYLLGEVPFKTVYLHGLVRDEEGRKMSKSLDNILNPLDVISEYGTDALRLSLMSGNTPGNDLRLGDEKLTASRNLVNKLWNMSRYLKMQEKAQGEPTLSTPADHWIAHKLAETRTSVTGHLASYNLSLAIEELRSFTTDSLADWYLELHKHEKNTPLLRAVFQELITLWHPFIPFVAEAMYQELFAKENDLLLVRPWPQALFFEKDIDPEFIEKCALAQKLVIEIRNLRSIYNIPPTEILSIQFVMLDDTAWMSKNLSSFLAIAKVSRQENVSGPVASVGSNTFLALLFLGKTFDLAKEKKRIELEIEEDKKYLDATKVRLANEGFMNNASNIVIENTKAQAEMLSKRITTREDSLTKLM